MSAAHSPGALLWTAAQQGDLCQVLLHVCNTTGQGFDNALIIAAKNDHEHVVAALLKARESSCTTYGGVQALWFAALSGSTSTVRVLLEAKASPNIGVRIAWCTTSWPLDAAVSSGRLDSVILLLRAGATVHSALPLYRAALMGYTHIVRALVAAKMDLDQEAGRQALKATAMWNFVDVLKVLLEAGMSPDFFHGSMTPLMWATVQGNDKVMRVLLDAKADVHLHVRPDGRKVQTACMHAVVDQDVGALKLLLDARVSVNVPQCMGDNQTGLLLHTAAASAASLDSFAQPAIVRALLRAKADVHGAAGPNAAGPAIVRSPIFAAVTTGSSAAVVRLLLRAGADLYPCLLDKATTHGSKDVARALIAHKAQSAVLELVQKPARQ